MAALVVAAAGAAIGGATLGTGVVALGMTGAQIGWMAGSMIGSMLFAPDAPPGPKIEDGKFTSSLYGQPIPLNYGTMRHATQVVWWSGLQVRTEEVGGKGGGGADVEYARMDLLLAVCEGPQAGVLRIWANGRLIATYNGQTFDLDKEVLPTGDVRVYVGTENQMPDPTYEQAVGTENAVAYRGMVMVAIDGLEGVEFANRPPNIECEVATEIQGSACPTEPIEVITPLYPLPQLGGGPGGQRHAMAMDFERSLLYYPSATEDGVRHYIEVYDLSEPGAATLSYTIPLPPWDDVQDGNGSITGIGYDPENNLVRVLWRADIYGRDGRPTELVWDGLQLHASPYVTAQIIFGATAPLYSIYSQAGDGPIGEAGLWQGNTVGQPLRGRMRSFGGLYGRYQFDGAYRSFTADVVHVGGNLNFALNAGDGQIIRDDNGSLTVLLSPGTSGSRLVHAPSRGAVYAFLGGGQLVKIDIETSAITDLGAVESPVSIMWAVWDDMANALQIGGYRGGTTNQFAVYLIDPDTWEVQRGPCYIDGGTSSSAAGARMLSDGRTVLAQDGVVKILPALSGAGKGLPVTLREIVEDVSARAGLPPESLDASAGTDLVAGFKIARQMSAQAAIESLRPVYLFDLPEVGSQLVLTKRGAPPVAVIDAGDLGAEVFSGSQDAPKAPYELEHTEAQEIPRRLEVTYVDFSADYDPGVQAAERQVGESRSPLQVEAPVVLDATQAARVAWANLLLAHSSAGQTRLSLTHKHDALAPADAIEVPHASGDMIRVRIEQITRARPLIEIEGVIEDASVYEQVMGGVPRYQGPQDGAVGDIGDTVLVLLDIPPLRDEDDSLLVYAAMARDDYDAYWPGGAAYKSTDGGVTYTAQASTATGATIGRMTSALGDWPGGNRWDGTNEVLVTVTSGSFSSASDAAVLNGTNALAVQAGSDWEIVQFADAELTGPNQWRLTRLLRGRIGTERCIDGHAVGDRVVLLAESALRTVAAPYSDVGAARQWKGVTSRQPLADAPAQGLTLAGRSLRPLSPVHVTMARQPNNDIVIDWVRRARINADWRWDGSDIPLDEPTEAYEIEIFGGTDVVRTLTASASQVTYTAAQQAEDFGGSVPTDFIAAVYQMSTRIGRGWPAVADFGAPGYSYEPDVTPQPLPGGGTTTPPVTPNDQRRFGWPMWWAGKWWTAPENETVAVDLGANADQFVRTTTPKWAKDRYRTRVNHDATGPSDNVPGVWGEAWNIGRGARWLATDGTVLAGAFGDDPEFTSAGLAPVTGLPDTNIQAWAPGWPGPKIARRRLPGPGESVWYTSALVSRWGAPGEEYPGEITSGATDGTTWAFTAAKEAGDGDTALITTTDWVTWTPIFLPDLSGWEASVFRPKILHSGSEWVLLHTDSSNAVRIYTSPDLATWTREADAPFSLEFDRAGQSGRAAVAGNIIAWGGDWYYRHDSSIYQTSDLVTWTLVHTISAALGAVVLPLATSAKIGWVSLDGMTVASTDGTTWAESQAETSAAAWLTLSRGVAVPRAPQSLPADVAFATQIDAGQGGAVFRLADFADTSPTVSLQPVTTFGAQVRTVGQRLGGEFREGGRVLDGNDQAQLFRVHSAGKRYFEVRWDSLAGVTQRWQAAAGIGADGYSWFGGVYGPINQWGQYTSKLLGPQLQAGDVLGCAVDADTGTITYWRNGALIGSFSVAAPPEGFTGGVMLGVPTARCTVLSLASELIYPLPAGYSAWND